MKSQGTNLTNRPAYYSNYSYHLSELYRHLNVFNLY